MDIQSLKQEILEVMSQKGMVNQTIYKMTILVFEHAEDYFRLVAMNEEEAAIIISRTFFERITSLLFILKEPEELKNRAKLFAYSSRIRELLRIQSLLGMHYPSGIDATLDAKYQHQDEWCKEHYHQSLVTVIEQHIQEEKAAFDNIAMLYDKPERIAKDQRRKGWCYLDPKVNDKFTKGVHNFSDLTQYVFDKEASFLYHYFYSFGSLYTHGYMHEKSWMLGFHPSLPFTSLLIQLLLLRLYRDICKWHNQSVSEKWIQMQNHLKAQCHLDFHLPTFKKIKLADETFNDLHKRLDNLIHVYKQLRAENRNRSAWILGRTIFALTETILSIAQDEEMYLSKIYLYQWSSKIEILMTIQQLLCYDGSNDYYNAMTQMIKQLLEQAREEYDAIMNVVDPKSVKAKRHRRHILTVSSQQMNMKYADFCKRYEEGFLSVYSHGIDLQNTYDFITEPLIFTTDEDLMLCDKLVQFNHYAFKKLKVHK